MQKSNPGRRFAVCVPTLNAGEGWKEWINRLDMQVDRPGIVLVIDSSSSDHTVKIARQHGYQVHSISQAEFNHGGTRQLAVSMLSSYEFVVFLTQDALLADNHALGNLINCFDDQRIGAAYGRQLPHVGANEIEAHARLFNYPATSRVKTRDDATELGIKTVFISNSFAAYRLTALHNVGGFPDDTIIGEDTIVAGRMLENDWKIAYCADACVYHSHHYTFAQEFRRYFDTGVLHAREPWIRSTYGQAGGEGQKFVRSELAYLFENNKWLVFSALVRNFLKFVSYQLGLKESWFPISIKTKLSMHKGYWRSEGQ